MTLPELDPCRCPLCGQPNACAMACGDQAATEPCWCTLVQFDAELLKQVPEAARNRACICQRCATTEPAVRT
ncbi:cysteine-rich CWC family protein [Limnohabitans sp. Rim8]|uniref:cysteine-rich CWC family protein n=1 Tax=Limnohabitans sp. Rim8 TaxID=1100718 RepID=UPI0025D44F0F|nr:cysteine-rich CWC family protein [Limnohabitans sp. Rim8]